MKSFGGPALFMDRSDINTDEIIPAKYLTEILNPDLHHCPKCEALMVWRQGNFRSFWGCSCVRFSL